MYSIVYVETCFKMDNRTIESWGRMDTTVCLMYIGACGRIDTVPIVCRGLWLNGHYI